MTTNSMKSIAALLMLLCINCAYGDSATSSKFIHVEPDEILLINDDLKARLDEYIRPIASKYDRSKELHAYLFTAAGLNIEYEANTTKTAQETFDTRSGNCVSLANLYVASARYLGLKAVFQKVKVPRDWEKREGFYILPDHMNVAVKINRGTRAIVELVSTYISRELEDEEIQDKQAFAEYYSNKGVEELELRNYQSAINNLEKSTKIFPDLTFAWSNLGVAYKFDGQFDKAENAYKKAIDLDKNYLSALKNLYALYYETNQQEKADKLSSRVKKYARKNPYFMAKTAEVLFEQKDFKGAIDFYKKAIGKKKEEGDFYFGLAKSYYMQGDLVKAQKAQKNAIKYSVDDRDKQRYSSKLDVINRKLEIR